MASTSNSNEPLHESIQVETFVRLAILHQKSGRMLRNDDIGKYVKGGSKLKTIRAQAEKILAATFGLELVPVVDPNAKKFIVKGYIVRSRIPEAIHRKMQQYQIKALQNSAATHSRMQAQKFNLTQNPSDPSTDNDASSSRSNLHLEKLICQALSQLNQDKPWVQTSSTQELTQYTLAGLVLAIILLQDRLATHDYIEGQLGKMGINLASPQMKQLSGIESFSALLNNLAAQKYITAASIGVSRSVETNARSQMPPTEWSWGPRAYIDFGEQAIGQFIVSILSTTDPSLDYQKELKYVEGAASKELNLRLEREDVNALKDKLEPPQKKKKK